jgi:hypothetical protein
MSDTALRALALRPDARAIAWGGRGSARRIGGRDDEKFVASLDLAADFGKGERERLAIGQDHRNQQALRALGQDFQGETDQLGASLDALAFGDVGRKPLAVQGNRVEADMHQDFGAIRSSQGEGVTGPVQSRHGAVAGGAQRAVDRIDGDAITQYAAAEDRVRDVDQRYYPAGDRGVQDDRRAHGVARGKCGGGDRSGHGNSPRVQRRRRCERRARRLGRGRMNVDVHHAQAMNCALCPVGADNAGSATLHQRAYDSLMALSHGGCVGSRTFGRIPTAP